MADGRQGHPLSWRVSKGTQGLFIKSCEHDMYLVTDGAELKTLKCIKNLKSFNVLWSTESACSQEYFITSICSKVRIGMNKNVLTNSLIWNRTENNDMYNICDVELSDSDDLDRDEMILRQNQDKSEKWKIESVKNEKGCFTLFNISQETFLGICGGISLKNSSCDRCKLKIMDAEFGGHYLCTKYSEYYLSWDKNDERFCLSSKKLEATVWKLEPCMPPVFVMNIIDREKSFSEWKDW